MGTCLLIGAIGYGVYRVRNYIRSNPEKINSFGSWVQDMFK